MALSKAFGLVLKDVRARAELSQEELAFDAGLHPTYVSQLERGLKSPSLEAVDALARVLDRRPHTLIQAAEDRLRT
jgi:transcriptional regulator with XRE-family HTH domain